MADAKRDSNYVPTLIAVSNVDGITPVTLYADPVTHRLLVSAVSGAGGADTQVQFNDGGALGGDSGMTYNKTTDTLSLAGNLELGHASDTTLSRLGAGRVGVEGVELIKADGSVTFAGNLIFTDNTYDIGASGATRPRNLYVSSGIAVASATASSGVVNVGTGFRIGNVAASGAYLRGNGTNFVSATIAAGDLPSALTPTTIELGHASDTTLSRVSAGVAAIEGQNIVVANTTATRTIVLTAGGGWPSTTAGCATNTKVEATTNDVDYYTLDFDKDTDEFAQWSVIMPDSYSGGTITATFYWTAASGSGDVIWGLQGRAYANDDAIDQAWGTAQTVTDSLITAGDVHVTSATSAITLAGSPAGGQLVQFRAYRDADAGGDTLSVDARLMMIKVEYPINSYTD